MVRAQAITIAAIVAVLILAACKQEAPAPPAAQAPAPPAAATTAPAQTVCPVMGGAIDKSIYVDYKGHRVYFCCHDCIAAFNKEPEKYLAKMKAQMPAAK